MSTQSKASTAESPLLKNLVYVGASLLVALLLEKGGAFDSIIQGTSQIKFLGAFIAGLFFTSFLTTLPAILALGHISTHSPLILTALIGGAGAVIGDLLIFSVVRKKSPRKLLSVMMYSRYCVENAKVCQILPIFKSRFFRILTPFIGALIIASPIPDEIGLSMLGLSNMSPRLFIIISYVMNTLGILLIGLAARSFM